MPQLLASLLHRSRNGLLALLIAVLPLQGVVQLVAGLQSQRHVHAGMAHAAASPSPLRHLLDRLHAAQPPALKGWGRVADHGAQPHAHGGLVHTHAAAQADVILLGDAGDDAGLGAATAFLAWLPQALTWPAALGSPVPPGPHHAWQSRVIAPPLTPPRG